MTDSKPSKSARKREQLALQQLGEKLIALSAEELDRIPLDDRLHHAVREATGIKSRSALRRQKQLIGKLMRSIDPGPVSNALAQQGAAEHLRKRVFADAERWRDRIVSDGAAGVDAFRTQTGNSDERLVTLVGELRTAPGDSAEHSIRRQIFRLVHDTLLLHIRGDRISQ